MPITEPQLFKLLTVKELIAARDALLSKRFTGLAAVQYADGSRNEYKTDSQMSAALAALDSELDRRRGVTPTSTIVVSSSKGLEA